MDCQATDEHRPHSRGWTSGLNPCRAHPLATFLRSQVMEFCGAGSLCDLMAICERTLNEEQIAIIMKMSLFGLEYLHAKKKIHRDVRTRMRTMRSAANADVESRSPSHRLSLSVVLRVTDQIGQYFDQSRWRLQAGSVHGAISTDASNAS
jgi:hypothetical protein